MFANRLILKEYRKIAPSLLRWEHKTDGDDNSLQDNLIKVSWNCMFRDNFYCLA